MKGIVFAKRTLKEILREPLSYIFCLGFPIVMLIIMSIVDRSIPAHANVTSFHIQNLTPGVAYFGLCFVMLFTEIQVSKDRQTSLLLRLYSSPMKPADYIVGYTLPVFALSLIQMVICYGAGLVIAAINGNDYPVTGALLSMAALIPSVFFFIGLGIIFGTLLSDKAAPGIGSILISAAGMLGGIWMDVDNMGGAIRDVACALPFYYGVKFARMPLAGSYDGFLRCALVCVLSGLLIYIPAVLIFRARMKRDIR